MPEVQYTTEEQIQAMRKELENAGADNSEKHNKKETKNKKNKGFSILMTTVFIVVVAILLSVLGSVLLAKERGESISFFGYSLYKIETGSMSPTLKVGTVILVKRPSDSSALEVDDIVTFTSLSGSTVTHRIVEIIQDEDGVSYKTKGDNPLNSIDRDNLTPDRVIGVFAAKIPLT